MWLLSGRKAGNEVNRACYRLTPDLGIKDFPRGFIIRDRQCRKVRAGW